MKPVLVLENELSEELAYLGRWLSINDIPFVVYNAQHHKQFPNSINEYSALAVMGGSMSANDALYTNRQAELLILQAMNRDIPVIGHCLGGQLMAKALGARIIKSPAPEIGWQPITYIDDPETEEWFGSNPTDKVLHWHYESFELPHGAKLLATSEACPNQAFSFGKHLAMQFHIEANEEKISCWTSGEEDWLVENTITVQTKSEIFEGIERHLNSHQETADNIYSNWIQTAIF